MKYIIKSIIKNYSNKVIRGNYKVLEKNDVDYFRSFMSENAIEIDNLDMYNNDWLKKYKGNSNLVLKPSNNEEVLKILQYCDQNKLAIVPQSGNTGLVGGSVPVFDEIILSLKKMNQIYHYDEFNEVIFCQSGCVLYDLNNYLEKFNKTMPHDLGAKGSCLIGGNLATHAGGIHFVKHGALKYNCKSIKVITPKEIFFLDDNKYDIKQLFIGSEGTLGIITECEINCKDLEKYKNIALIGLNSFHRCIEIFYKAKRFFKSDLSAIEYFDTNCLDLLGKQLNMNRPFYYEYPYYLLLEISTDRQDNMDYLIYFLEQDNDLPELVLSTNEKQLTDLWKYREKISEASSKNGICFKYDVSIPLTHFENVVKDIREKIGNLAYVLGYGHIGDCNLHLNICYDKFIKDEDYNKIENILEPYIYDKLKELGGSVSAEHGIGLAKKDYLNRSQCEKNISTMRLIKDALDPNKILNPYKLI
jgi:FAD/FMN-containing dehydrogenase